MSKSRSRSKYKSKSDSESESKSNPRLSFLAIVGAVGLALAISALHIAYTKGRSWFLIPYIVVFLAIVVAIAAIVWPRSASAVDSGIQTDSGVSARVSEDGSVFQAEDNAFAPYPDESIDAGLCEVPK